MVPALRPRETSTKRQHPYATKTSPVDCDLVWDASSEALTQIDGQAMLDEDCAVATVLVEHTGMSIKQCHYEVTASLPLDGVHPLTLAAVIPIGHNPIELKMDFLQGYRATCPRPSISISQGDLQTSSSRVNPGFPLGLQLAQSVTAFLDERWAHKGDDFLADLFLRLWDRLHNAGNTCQLCDRPLEFPSLKPTTCEADLCRHQQETLKLGVKLSLLSTGRDVADLLISAAAAACADTDRYKVSPVTLPWGQSNAAYTPERVLDVLTRLPNVDVLADARENRMAVLDSVDPSAADILCWIFVTNKVHITRLEPERCSPEMQTEFQFEIHTATRAHVAKFEQLRQQYGSTLAFHGSPLSNWHNILRQRLRNASGTPMMSSGMQGGKGIYLARTSGTCVPYMRQTAGWPQSRFGDRPSCLGLFEVANTSAVRSRVNNTDVLVVSDEDCVVLRKLFVYPQSLNLPTNVLATSLSASRYRNQTTIAYGLALEEVHEEDLLVTSDGYFWDMNEILAMVTAQSGRFINGYTQQPFAPFDVHAMIKHPSVASATLEIWESLNLGKRCLIPKDVISRLYATGRICQNAGSGNEEAARAAISELRTWLKSQPEMVVRALENVPFMAIDSRTGEKFRDTVIRATEMAYSGVVRIYRYGDFLSQIE